MSYFVQAQNFNVEIVNKFTLDSLGACQGVFVNGKNIYLYGDREVGVIRKYKFQNNSLQFTGNEIKLSKNGKDVINHPTGIALINGKSFIGNSSRLNEEGTLWKAGIFMVDWNRLLQNKSLEKTFYKEIEDNAAIQGTRPELVKFNGKKYVATADYGNKKNEVRFYDIQKLSSVSKTSQNVLKFKFSCSPWVQNLHWIKGTNVLVLVQNQIEGKYWRLTFLDLKESVKTGKEKVLSVIDFKDASELEGFAFVNKNTAIAVTSSRTNNAAILKISKK